MTVPYEITSILKPTLDETELAAAIQRVTDQLATQGGTLIHLEQLGRRRLAYEIDDLREGYYIIYTFTLDADQISEFERRLKLNDTVIRSLIIRLESVPKPPSPETQASSVAVAAA